MKGVRNTYQGSPEQSGTKVPLSSVDGVLGEGTDNRSQYRPYIFINNLAQSTSQNLGMNMFMTGIDSSNMSVLAMKGGPSVTLDVDCVKATVGLKISGSL